MPLNRLLDYILGYTEIEIPSCSAEECMNVLHRNNVLAGKMKKNSDVFKFEIRCQSSDKVCSLLDKTGIKVYSIKGKGLPFFLNKYKRRYGIIIGSLIFCFSVYISRLFVWQITFSGNDNISDTVIEERLLEAGFGVGTYIPNVDFYDLCNTFLQNSDDISFVSVNMEGTTAHIELRERKVKDEDGNYTASNIVAKYSGQIDSMTIYSGNAVVENMSVVKDGDLLVSGFLEKPFGFETVRSRGSVYAYVTRTFEIDIPFEKQVKEYTGTVHRAMNISFFGKSFKVYSELEKSKGDYDTVKDAERVVLFGKIKLPIIIDETANREYVMKTVTLDEEEARHEAEKEMTKLLLKELSDSEVLERRTEVEITDRSYRLICEVYCLTDIALEKEIKVGSN